MSEPPPVAGLLVVDKPYGRTSAWACAVIKGKLKAGGAPKRIKVGHGGTLDPLATGVLVVLVGRATKLCDHVMGGTKRYIAEVDLARVSPTDDLESEPTPVPVQTPPTLAAVRRACQRFVGEVDQLPPAHSAVKVGGKRAYQLARTGRTPDIEPRRVRIDAIDVLEYDWPRLVIDVRCGKGVYIRSLARDLGKPLCAGGVLTALRRTAVGRWTIDQAVPIERLPEVLDPRALDVPGDLRRAPGHDAG